MNREIKFRGKRIDNSKFVEGSLLIEKVDCPVLKVDQHGEYKQLEEVTLYSICVDGGTEDGKIWNTVDPKTVGQYTGLKDANGVEIYEGDIITCQEYPFYGIAYGIDGYKGECKELNYVGEVWYSEEEATYFVELKVVSNRVSGRAIGGVLSEYKNCTVVGNIHDNPELLPN